MTRHQCVSRIKTMVASLGFCLAAAASAAAQTIAFDNGDPTDSDPRPEFINSAYADGWDPLDNGGYGFLPWDDSLFYGNPIEIDTSPQESDNDLGTPAFRFGTGGAGYWAVRPFAAGIAPGQSFRINFDSFTFPNTIPDGPFNWMFGLRSPAGERLSLYAYDYYIAGQPLFGGEKFGVYATSANSNLDGGASLPTTGCGGGNFCTNFTAADGSDGFTLTVDVLTLNTYRMRIEDDGMTKLDITGQMQMGTRADQQLTNFFVWSAEESNQLHTSYFSNIEILVTPPEAGLDGDYNDDGTVDTADYVVWRKLEGTSTPMANDPNPLPIDMDQYNTWRANFGEAGAGAGGSAVPEPSAIAIIMLGFAWLLPRRRSN